MTEEPFSERLKRLEDRIAAARAGRAEPPSAHRGEFTQGTVAWRMVTELVIGMALGVGLGLGLDSLLGTRPVFLVIFALLGFAGGVRALMRTAEEVRAKRDVPAAGTGGSESGGRRGDGRGATDRDDEE